MFLAAAFLCTVVAVHDGDTLRCSSGTRVRLNGIDAPEIGRCPPHRWCAKGNAVASREALKRLVLRKTIRCVPTNPTYNRIAAWCSVAGADVSCAMFRGGWAIRRWDYDRGLCRR